MKSIQYIIITILIIIFTPTISAQTWLWATGISSSGCNGNYGDFISLNPSGRIYCSGDYGGLCSITAADSTLDGGGSGNAYLASFDESGTLLSITNVPAAYTPQFPSGDLFTSKPVFDDSGYVYNTINFNGSALIDTINVFTAYSSSEDLLVKWNSNMHALWVKDYPGIFDPVIYNASLYILGNSVQDSIKVDSFTIYGGSVNQPINYVAGLDLNGACKWVNQATGGNITINKMRAQNNHIFICAQTDSCFNFDTIRYCGETGYGTGFLIQTDTNGKVQWRSTFSALGLGVGVYSFSIDADNNCYMVGGFDSTFYIGNDTLYKRTGDIYDNFVSKFNSAGQLVWIKQIYRTGNIGANYIYTDASGYSYVGGGGNAGATIIFATDTIIPTVPEPFLTRYTPSGTKMGDLVMPDLSFYSLTEDEAGNIYMTGAVFGSFTFGSTTLTGDPNFGDFFIAKMSGITDSTSAIESIAPCDNTLQIFANPNTGSFTIKVPQCIIHANTGNLKVYNDVGNVIITQTIDLSTGQVPVNLGAVTPGVYNILLTANGQQFTGRVVIQ